MQVIDETGFKAIGNTLLFKVLPVEEKKARVMEGGIVLPGGIENDVGIKINKLNYNGKARGRAILISIGNAVDKEKYPVEIGTEYLLNDMDIQTIAEDTTLGILYICTRPESVRCTVKYIEAQEN